MMYLSTYETQDPYIKRRTTICTKRLAKSLFEDTFDVEKTDYDLAVTLTYYEILIEYIKFGFYSHTDKEFQVSVYSEKDSFLKVVCLEEEYLDKVIKKVITKEKFDALGNAKPSPKQIDYFNTLQAKLKTNYVLPENNYPLFSSLLQHLIKKSKERNLTLGDERPATEKQISALVRLYNLYLDEGEINLEAEQLKKLTRTGADDLFKIVNFNVPAVIPELMMRYLKENGVIGDSKPLYVADNNSNVIYVSFK